MNKQHIIYIDRNETIEQFISRRMKEKMKEKPIQSWDEIEIARIRHHNQLAKKDLKKFMKGKKK